jgi:hypothetical protein
MALSSDVEYLNSRDATIMGSRNGHAPIYLWCGPAPRMCRQAAPPPCPCQRQPPGSCPTGNAGRRALAPAPLRPTCSCSRRTSAPQAHFL